MKSFLRRKPIMYTLIVLTIVCSLYFIIQKSTSLSPSETVMTFDKEAKQGHIEETKKFISKDLLRSIEEGKFWWIKTYSAVIDQYNNGSYNKVIPLSEEILGDIATVNVEITKKDGSKKKKSFKFVKEDGHWKLADF
jgi:hypothetical protein